MANNFIVKDASNTTVTFRATDVGGGTELTLHGIADGISGSPITNTTPFSVTIRDPASGFGALVQAFHNSDNQALGTVYGIMTGGVDQLLNGSGNLDRKRGVAGDAMAVTGLAAEVPMVWNGASYDRVRSAPGATGVLAASLDGVKATYRYAGLAFAPVATPTDIIIIKGSGTTTIRIKRIKLSGVATAAGNMPAQLVRRSSAGTLGSAVLAAVTGIKHDINDAAATATISTVGTANYTTLGTLVGALAADRLQMAATGAGVGFTPLCWDFSTRSDKALVLRGTSDFICINLNGAAIPAGGVVDYEIETEEDSS